MAESCIKTNVDSLVFDGYRPVIGRNVCIDAGATDALDILPAFDVQGGQRVYNGRLDIGAVEADWRGRYGRDIGSRMEVLSASPAVFEQTDGTVRVPDGASLGGVLSGRTDKLYLADLTIRVVDGTSKLILGEEERLLDAGTHTIRVSVNQAGLPVSIVAMSGMADILQAKAVNGFAVTIR